MSPQRTTNLVNAILAGCGVSCRYAYADGKFRWTFSTGERTESARYAVMLAERKINVDMGKLLT